MIIDLFELLDAVVRVHLRRPKGTVPQQLLDFPHVGSSVEQVGGKRMPQYVRTALALYTRRRQLRADDPVHRAAADASPLLG